MMALRMTITRFASALTPVFPFSDQQKRPLGKKRSAPKGAGSRNSEPAVGDEADMHSMRGLLKGSALRPSDFARPARASQGGGQQPDRHGESGGRQGDRAADRPRVAKAGDSERQERQEKTKPKGIHVKPPLDGGVFIPRRA